MTTNFSPVLGVLCFTLIPKNYNVCNEGIIHISQWSNTGPSWPSRFYTSRLLNILSAFPYKEKRSAGMGMIHVPITVIKSWREDRGSLEFKPLTPPVGAL